MLCSYCLYTSGTPQFDWLVKDLQNIDRTLTPWVIAVLHAPWYNSNTAHHNEGEEVRMRAAMERIFFNSKVDLVLADRHAVLAAAGGCKMKEEGRRR